MTNEALWLTQLCTWDTELMHLSYTLTDKVNFLKLFMKHHTYRTSKSWDSSWAYCTTMKILFLNYRLCPHMHALSFEFLVAGPMQVVFDTRVLSSIWNFQEPVYFTAHFGWSRPISANQNCWWCRVSGPFCPMFFPMAVTTCSICLTYLVN